MKVSIIGQGYVGLSIAMSAASAGMRVIGFDLNEEIVQRLNLGNSHVEGVSKSDLLMATASGNYLATSNPNKLNNSDVILIAVPTPLNKDLNPDLSYIHSAVDLINGFVTSPTLIINESTSFPGTLRREIAGRIGRSIHLFASSPERVDPGNLIWGHANTPRLIGALDNSALRKAKEFYSMFCNEIIEVSSPEVAEAAKLFENTFRQVNIALVNEFAQISHGLGLSVREILSAAATKPFGFMSFSPSAGVGGHCIPIDPMYLLHVSDEVGIPATLIKQANQVNKLMPSYVVQRVIAAAGGSLKGKRLVVVGVSYKANIADTRETPAAAVIDLLRAKGANVVWHDDLVGTWRGESSTPLDAQDIAVVVTKHDNVNEEVIKASGYVFDCTGTILGVDGI